MVVKKQIFVFRPFVATSVVLAYPVGLRAAPAIAAEDPLNPPRLAELGLPAEGLAKLIGDGQLVLLHPGRAAAIGGKNREVRFASAAVRIAAPVSAVAAVVQDFAAYPEFKPQTEKVSVTKAPDGADRVAFRLRFELPLGGAKVTPTSRGLMVDWQLGIGFRILAIPLKYRLEYVDVGPATMPFRRVSGDLDYVWGAWEWLADGDDRTLVIYTTGSQLGDRA